MSAAAEDAVTEAPAVEAVPKRAMTLGTGTSLVVLAALLIAPVFLKNFVIFQMTMVMIYGVAVLALNILTGGSGQFSLGQSAFYALGAYTTAALMENVNMNYALTLPIAGLVSFAAGFLFGRPALRLSGIYLALATFALAVAMPQFLKLHFLESWTGGVQGLVVLKPDAPFGLPIDQDKWLYYFTLAITLAIYIASVNLLRSRSGRAMMAIRDNEIAASAMGVDVALYKTLAFGVSAAITGIAGSLFVLVTNGFAQPNEFGVILSLQILIGAAVAGLGSLWGALVGALFIGLLPEISNSVPLIGSGHGQDVVFGLVVILVMVLLPNGVAGLLRTIDSRFKSAIKSGPPAS
jgi:branched-chain amino acid transport system permease protein